ncbi:hypothetical protein GCM10027168_13150 [Streptomyces capparidis]
MRDPAEPVWTWSRERTVGFRLRMQTIEAAVHRWDAQVAPVDGVLVADAVSQTFQVMAPFRRAAEWAPAARASSACCAGPAAAPAVWSRPARRRTSCCSCGAVSPPTAWR